MVKTIEATFDGTAFLPAEPIQIEPNTRVRLTIETEDAPDGPTHVVLGHRTLSEPEGASGLVGQVPRISLRKGCREWTLRCSSTLRTQ